MPNMGTLFFAKLEALVLVFSIIQRIPFKSLTSTNLGCKFCNNRQSAFKQTKKRNAVLFLGMRMRAVMLTPSNCSY